MDKPLPYSDFLYIKPKEKQQILVSQNKSLFEVGEVLALGPDVGKHEFWLFRIFGIKAKNSTKVGDLVAYEHWDMPDVEGLDGKIYCFLREKDAICKF